MGSVVYVVNISCLSTIGYGNAVTSSLHVYMNSRWEGICFLYISVYILFSVVHIYLGSVVYVVYKSCLSTVGYGDVVSSSWPGKNRGDGCL